MRKQDAWLGARSLGFSMIELLVVIAIVSLLVALLVPAVQYARAASWRAKCQGNLRQIGHAMANYHDVHNVLPPGHITFLNPPTTLPPEPRTPWLAQLLAQLGEQTLFDSYNFDLGMVGFGGDGIAANSTAHLARIAMLVCPADRNSLQTVTDTPFARCKGNYAVNWGNTTWWQTNSPGNPFRKAPFGTNSNVRLGGISDGLSQTVLASEMVSGVNGDFRGDQWNDDAGTSQFYTTITPNSSAPDRLPDPWCIPTGNPPCQTVLSRSMAFSAARSRHASGVHVLFADGSVRWVANEVEHETWMSIGSISGSEPTATF